MDFSLDHRTCRLSVGEFAGFTLGPRDGGGGSQGIWRAQLGMHWHQQLRAQTLADDPAAEFEIAIEGRIFHRGWTFTFIGRIDQLIRPNGGVTLREIKTVTRPLPVDESELRADYPEYFIQLATYATLWRLAPRSATSASPADLGAARLPLVPLPSSPAPGADSPAPHPSPSSLAPAPPVTRHSHSPLASAPLAPTRAELIFVEAGSGLAQTITFTPADDGLFRTQLERVAEFLDLRLRARERLRNLRFRPPFASARPGQETTVRDLEAAVSNQQSAIFFEAPTGFGKTGVLLEFALGQLRSGHFDRALYLTSKSTGQLQVVRTLAAMTSPDVRHPLGDNSSGPSPQEQNAVRHPMGDNSTPVAAWHVRNKSEHCINHTFHCVRDTCAFLQGAESRWPQSGLARFYLFENEPRDIASLRAAGRAATICPYEITRAALAFNDVWIGDYNYVFSPRNRGLFYQQPGFDPARTLLLVDEAHNLPTRVADVYTHTFSSANAFAVSTELHRIRPPSRFLSQWEQWAQFLQGLNPRDALSLGDEDEAHHLLTDLANAVSLTPLDYASLSPATADELWRIPTLINELEIELPRLWWSPRAGELSLHCLDAAAAIGTTLREFGGVVLASATFGSADYFATACGLDKLTGDEAPRPERAAAPDRLGVLNKRDTRRLFTQLTSAAELLKVEEANDAANPALVRAGTPWRDGAYDIAVDARVDTTFHHRAKFHETTAATIEALYTAATSAASANEGASVTPRVVAVFFPSYAYAEAIQHVLRNSGSALRVALQPRLPDLAAQTAWVEESLVAADALFLVLGSSFAESIDLLGGRVTHAMVVGPALPEVNAVQRARLNELTRPTRIDVPPISREAAFRRVYQIPGMTKVNQALGRLVRAPGQHARVLLHCQRFLEPSYANLLAAEYQRGLPLQSDAAFAAWLGGRAGL